MLDGRGASGPVSLPSIKILVSCHKDVAYPRSDVFLPIQVGAAGKAPLEGMQPDDEGENISERNFSYSELTAQYWAWKNLESDYIGLCHYRRYFCFDGKKHRANDHAQIEESCLCPRTVDLYHIADEQAIRSLLEEHELVCAPSWSVLGAPTPNGIMRSVRSHMVGYDLLTDADLDELVRICRKLSPEYEEDLVRYLCGRRYLGYNCFIMKRELFEQLCDFEFPILREFDEGFSYEGLTGNRLRICGYLGEILFSAFVCHLERGGDCSIARVPLVFFEHTPPRLSLEVAPGHLGLFWRYRGTSSAQLTVCVRSLIGQICPTREYDLTIIHDVDFDCGRFLGLLGKTPPNLNVSLGTVQTLDLKTLPREFGEAELEALLPMLLPSLVSGDERGRRGIGLWFEGCPLFVGDPGCIAQSASGAPLSAFGASVVAVDLDGEHALPCADELLSLLGGALERGSRGKGNPAAVRGDLLARLGAAELPPECVGAVLHGADGALDDEELLSFARGTSAYDALLAERERMGTPSLKDRLFPPHSPLRKALGRVRGILRGIARR